MGLRPPVPPHCAIAIARAIARLIGEAGEQRNETATAAIGSRIREAAA
jgi:hypothetical protein